MRRNKQQRKEIVLKGLYKNLYYGHNLTEMHTKYNIAKRDFIYFELELDEYIKKKVSRREIRYFITDKGSEYLYSII